MNTSSPAVVFDLGKVLLDFDYGIAAAKFQKRSKLTLAETRRVIDQSPLLGQLETNALSIEQFFEELCRATGYHGSLEEFRDIFCHVFTPIPPMIELHAKLRERGVSTYIFSNTNFLQIDHIRRTYPFIAHFDGYVLSCEHGVMKPDARLYEVVERMTGKRGADLLYIDDRGENVATGQARGWRTIHHTGPSATIAAVRAEGLLGSI